jgi:RHS repeat-associated protein
MAGISSKAAVSLRNRYKFNYGTELSNEEFGDGSGLEWYETAHRSYDSQIGRFHQVDPLGELTMDFSLYSFAYNNPILFNDPLGLTPNEFNGPQNITGWVQRPDGTAYFDPKVHDQKDLDPKSGLTYIGEEIIIKDDDGNIIGFGNDQGGISYNINLVNVTVTAPAKKKSNGYFWGGALDIVQTGIDIAGLIPLVGEIADGANALIYTARGDYTNAALSTAAMIPIAGWGATGGKFVNKALKFTKDQQALIDIAKAAKKTGGVTETEAKILKEWSDEYNMPFRGPEAHPNRPFNLPHIHVGPVDHIIVK